MTLNEPPILPTDPQPPTPDSAARRRRARRAQMIPDAEGRAEVMASLAKRAYPNVEFFVFAVLGGAVLGLGYLLDSPAVLLFGILLAPLMTPWVGMTLALVTGSLRFFFETLVALLISVMLVFLSGLMAGLAARPFLPLTSHNAQVSARLWLPGLVVLALGALLLVISFVRSEEKPFLPSVLVAYSLLAPISAAGFGLGSGTPGLWPTGALVFIVHLALATLLGMLVFMIFGFRPSKLGWLTSGGALLILGAVLAFLMVPSLQPVLQPAATYTPTATRTPPPTVRVVIPSTSTASPQPTRTPRVQTATPSRLPITQTETPAPTETATITLTVAPTPVYARISSDTGGGVNLRKAPNGEYIATLDNGSVVEVLAETQEVSGVMWAHVIATKNGRRLEGWILQSVLTTATPVPNWQPTDTPTPTDTVEATQAP